MTPSTTPSTTRRLRIEDLLDVAVPSQPALVARRVAGRLRAAHPRRRGGPERRRALARADRGRAAPPAHPRSRRHRPGLVAGRLAARLPPRRPGRRAGRSCGEAEVLTHLPLGAGAPRWSPDGRRLAFTAPVDPAPGRRADGRRRHRLPGRRRRHVRRGPQPAARPRPRDRAAAPADRRPRERRRAGLVAGRHHAGLHPRRPASAFRVPVHLLAVDDPHARPRTIALADGVALAVTWTRRRPRPCWWSATRATRSATPTCSASQSPAASATDLGADLDRNVMPGAPAYPGGLPAEHDGRVLFCLRDRGCTHLWSVAADGGDARPVLDGAGRVVSGLSVAAGPGGARAGHAHVVRRGRGARPGHRRRDRAHRPRRTAGRRGAPPARGAHLHDLRRHRGRGLAGPRPGAAGAAPAAARRARRPAQRVERRGRRDPPLPPGAGRARLGGAAAQPARQRRLRRGLLRRRPRRVGRRGRRRLPRAARPAGRRGAGRPGPARGRAATATAGSWPAG